MPSPGKKRSRNKIDPTPGVGHAELVQTHVTIQAKKMIRDRAAAAAISEAAVVRQLIYRGLGLMPEEKPNG